MTKEQSDAAQLAYTPGMTLREACLQASSLLSAEGVSEPRSNAELLLMHLLGKERAELLRDWVEPMPVEKWDIWREYIGRKLAGEPVQYIMREQWFYGLPFHVQPGVLIPRPETELLVEAVLEAADRLWPQAAGGEAGGESPARDRQVPTVIDVGTGSGAIAVTLAVQRPAWRVCASDLSEDALEVARTNAARHEEGQRITFVQGDLLGPFMVRPDGVGSASGGVAGLRADILVSNPPYIPAGELAHLQREVRDYEPRLALDGGADGLDPYRRMLEQLPGLASVPRIVAFELGMGQAQEVARLLREYGAWQEIRIIEDYAGIERHVIAIG
ncbi:peptide chain release factor N(5)-glutamine methyltransferase [Paenibacillus abyssi]|uniref:Release factor glutamine methyltransferase n=1 Tax=Paenibacillus abyssi TaxID=1340531 RepID=A0A917FP20_9BACL|nr:peptide chain release factor N(5)-glutamine methyltransferase [Paenibacillus abyssi]GGF92026.1 release factor glutamine methyltransferase [Paenibacillus abyssi]